MPRPSRRELETEVAAVHLSLGQAFRNLEAVRARAEAAQRWADECYDKLKSYREGPWGETEVGRLTKLVEWLALPYGEMDPIFPTTMADGLTVTVNSELRDTWMRVVRGRSAGPSPDEEGPGQVAPAAHTEG